MRNKQKILVCLSLLLLTLFFSYKATSQVVVTGGGFWVTVRERPVVRDELVILYRERPDFDMLTEREQVEWIFDHDNKYPLMSEQVIVWNESYPDRYPWFWVHPRWTIWMNSYPHPEVIFANHETFCYHFVQLPGAAVYFNSHPAYVNLVNRHTTVNNYFIHNDNLKHFSKEEQAKNPQNPANQNHSAGTNQNHSAAANQQSHSTGTSQQNHSTKTNKQSLSASAKQKHSASQQKKLLNSSQKRNRNKLRKKKRENNKIFGKLRIINDFDYLIISKKNRYFFAGLISVFFNIYSPFFNAFSTAFFITLLLPVAPVIESTLSDCELIIFSIILSAP